MAHLPPPRFEYRSCRRRICPYSDDPHQHRTLVVGNPEPYSDIHILSPITSMSDASQEYDVVRRLQVIRDSRLAIAHFAEFSTEGLARRLRSLSSSLSLRRRRRPARTTGSENETAILTSDSESTISLVLTSTARCWWHDSSLQNGTTPDTQQMIASQDQDDEERTKLGSQRRFPLKPVEKYLNDMRMKSYNSLKYSSFDGLISTGDVVVMQARLPDYPHVSNPCTSSASRRSGPEIRLIPPSPEPPQSGNIQSDHRRQGEPLRNRTLSILSKLLPRSRNKLRRPQGNKKSDNSEEHLKTGHLKVPDHPLYDIPDKSQGHDGSQRVIPNTCEYGDIEPVESRLGTGLDHHETIHSPAQGVTDDHNVNANGKHVPTQTLRNTSKRYPNLVERAVQKLGRSENCSNRSKPAEKSASTLAEQRQVVTIPQSGDETQEERQRVLEKTVDCPGPLPASDSSNRLPSFWKGSDKEKLYARLKDFVRGKRGQQRPAPLTTYRARALWTSESNEPLSVRIPFRTSFSFDSAASSFQNPTNGSCRTDRSISPRSRQPR
jgi:hypothetical protein